MVRYTTFLLAPAVTAFAPSINLFPRMQRLAAEGNVAPKLESENRIEDDVESVLESPTNAGEYCT